VEPTAPPTFHMEPPAIHLHVFTQSAGVLLTHLSVIGETAGPFPFFAADGTLLSD